MLVKLVTALAFSIAALPSNPVRIDGDGLPKARPETVEMSALRLDAITRVVRRGISEGGFPGAAVVVGRRGAAVYSQGFGRLSWGADAPSVSPDRTVYDLASLTKVIGTTTAIMLLYDAGKLTLDDRSFAYWFPGDGLPVDTREKLRMPLAQISSSGLPTPRCGLLLGM